jgi:transaldolase
MIRAGNSISLVKAKIMPLTNVTETRPNSPNTPPEPGLRLFLDSAAPEDWARFLPLGVFYGVTTNPLLLQRAGQDCTLQNLEKLAAQVAELGVRELQMQVWGDTPTAMFDSGSQLAQLASIGLDIVIKVPATEDGYQVARHLSDAGARITMTAVYTPGQVLLAAGFGAAYAAPYLGRMLDAGQPGREIVLAMNTILQPTAGASRLLVASLRQAEQVVDLAQQGLDTFTFGAPVAAELFASDLTSQAAAQFQAAALAMNGQD